MQLGPVAHGPIGLFGKVPAHGDFVRSGVADPLVQRFTRWLEEGSEACHRAGTKLPAEPARFLFRAGGDARALVGALRGSVDKVGREFPLAILVPADGALVRESFPTVPLAYRAFLDGAEALLAESAALAAQALAERVKALPLPAVADLRAAEDGAREALDRVRGSDFHLRLLGGDAGGGAPYGLNLFDSACRPLRGREPSAAGTALACPADDADSLWGWLELARRGLGWRAAPAFFWRTGAAGRVLLSLGPAPAWLLPSLAEPRRDGPRVWPLVSSDPQASIAALRALGPARAAAVERPDARLDEIAAALFS